RRGRAARFWRRGSTDVIGGDVDLAALRLEERDRCPDLVFRELLPHVGHDRIEAGNDVCLRLRQRLVEIRLATHVRLARAAARADGALTLVVGNEIRRARSQAMAGGAAARPVINLLTGSDERLRCG